MSTSEGSVTRPAAADSAVHESSADDSAGIRRLQDATEGLRNNHPELSAAGSVWPTQIAVLAVVAGLLAIAAAHPASMLAHVLLVALMLPFLCIVAVRALVVAYLYRPAPRSEPPRDADATLPAYTVIVALYREAPIARQLVHSLAALDYPAKLLQVLFVTEANDHETRQALGRCALPPHMHVISVPDGQPRTKPRALNYALAEATGEFVVVYDAEDEPEPDQLRRAVSAFRSSGSDLGCLQARLKIYNADATWMTRQFAIEYAALFGSILPALERWRLPITLGGTSNHFPRNVLHAVGAWDAYNVTEDADLGVRLARFGWRVATLDSVTWEEAPATVTAWRKQRIRWIKGWLQTALVHTRQPWRLYRELGAWATAGLLVTFASMLLSPIVHPAYIAALVIMLATDAGSGETIDWLAWLGFGIFAAGYGVSIAVALHAARTSGLRHLATQTAWLPAYWLMISWAAYAAVHEFAVRRFHWNKTDHTGRVAAPQSGLPAEEVADQLQP